MVTINLKVSMCRDTIANSNMTKAYVVNPCNTDVNIPLNTIDVHVYSDLCQALLQILVLLPLSECCILYSVLPSLPGTTAIHMYCLWVATCYQAKALVTDSTLLACLLSQ